MTQGAPFFTFINGLDGRVYMGLDEIEYNGLDGLLLKIDSKFIFTYKLMRFSMMIRQQTNKFKLRI